MKIAVVGSRTFKDILLMAHILIPEWNNAEDTLISGGAIGADSLAEELINSHFINPKVVIFKPDWGKYGKRAGFIRNELIINEADKVIAFWDGQSKGTKHSIDLAIKARKPVDIYVRN